MVKRARVACFLTCGYTEAGAMQAFLGKINSALEFKQYLPNRTRKRKGMPKRILRDINGLTGDALLEKTYELIRKYRLEIAECAAVLIEDDLDNRFHGWSQNRIDAFIQKIRSSVCEAAEFDLPVFILYAAPEVESWFIADWNGGFGYLYGRSNVDFHLAKEVREYYVYHLKNYIMTEVLQQFQDDIENFGISDGAYVKLSDQLIDAVDQGVKSYMEQTVNANKEFIHQIRCSRELFYSKDVHGDLMLREIAPLRIADQIYMRHFRRAYHEISSFTIG